MVITSVVCDNISTASSRHFASERGRRSIVMSMSLCVCVSVCLSATISPEPCAIFTNLCTCCLYGHGSVLLRQGDKIPRGRGNFGGCPGQSKALAIFALAIFAAAVTAAFAAKGISQSPAEGIIQYARQAQIGIRKILNEGDAVYRPGRG